MKNKKTFGYILLFLAASIVNLGFDRLQCYGSGLSIEKDVNEKVGNIVVEITGCESKKGDLIICLYDKKDISEVKLAWKKIVVTPDEKQVVTFKDIPYGQYAIFIVHDKDRDGEFTMRWLPYPKPKDGAGYSNNAEPKFGPADYEDAKFQHNKTKTIQKISMIYG